MTCDVCVCGDNVTIDCFTSLFPEFYGMNDVQFCNMFMKAHIYVDPHACPSGWIHEQHKLAVCLAIAHCFFKTQEGKTIIEGNGLLSDDYVGNGNVNMASEGSVTIMKKTYSPGSATENDLMGSVYGEQLLSLYEGINPPLEEVQLAPYYPVGY